MRGLKQERINNELLELQVASFTDAWIETPTPSSVRTIFLSHLLQMRGLKHYKRPTDSNGWQVASFTDAWIETMSDGVIDKPEIVASFTDAWIETDAK